MAQTAPGKTASMLVPGLVAMTGQDGGGPALIGSRCASCDTVVFPRMGVCPACLKPDTMRPAEIGRTGKLYSFTVARAASAGFKAPYFQAYVDLPEGPRVFALISETVPIENASLREGMDLTLVVEPVRTDPSGQPVLTYKYRPANGSARPS